MNIYLYSVLNNDGIVIKKMIATSRRQCEDKIKAIYTKEYDVDDTLSFDAFAEDLCDRYDILIGEIRNILISIISACTDMQMTSY